MAGKSSGHKKPGGTHSARKRAAKKRARLVAVIVVVVVGAGIATAFAFGHGTTPEAYPTPSAAASATDTGTDAGTDAPPADESAAEESANPDEVQPLPVETPSDTPMARTQIDAYCHDYQTILAAMPKNDQSQSDSDHIQWAQMSKQYSDMLARYQAASANAPASLVPAYANATSYLRALKQSVDTKDVSALQAQLHMLATLNNAMDLIDTRSQTLCHIK